MHSLPPKLQSSALATAKSVFADVNETYGKEVRNQQERRAQKKCDIRITKLATSKKKFTESTWLHQQKKSPRCWNTRKKALDEFNKLPSHTKQLKYTKEQILIRYLGCGWKEAHHPWSKYTHIYTATELLDHFLHIVLPLDKSEKY